MLTTSHSHNFLWVKNEIRTHVIKLGFMLASYSLSKTTCKVLAWFAGEQNFWAALVALSRTKDYVRVIWTLGPSFAVIITKVAIQTVTWLCTTINGCWWGFGNAACRSSSSRSRDVCHFLAWASQNVGVTTKTPFMKQTDTVCITLIRRLSRASLTSQIYNYAISGATQHEKSSYFTLIIGPSVGRGKQKWSIWVKWKCTTVLVLILTWNYPKLNSTFSCSCFRTTHEVACTGTVQAQYHTKVSLSVHWASSIKRETCGYQALCIRHQAALYSCFSHHNSNKRLSHSWNMPQTPLICNSGWFSNSWPLVFTVGYAIMIIITIHDLYKRKLPSRRNMVFREALCNNKY